MAGPTGSHPGPCGTQITGTCEEKGFCVPQTSRATLWRLGKVACRRRLNFL